jgi:ATP-dependent exoDNAse (exonuclease V) alpha subunit
MCVLQSTLVVSPDNESREINSQIHRAMQKSGQKLANRKLGMVEKIDGDGNLKLKMDSGREVEFNTRQHPHLDYGYAVTSHSSQGPGLRPRAHPC